MLKNQHKLTAKGGNHKSDPGGKVSEHLLVD